MSSKVEVLCPNAHRVNIKTTPNTTLVQILEEACTKKGFLPASDYELRHGSSKKPLDLTLTLRFAGLPNLAKLEMVKAAKSREVLDVTVALQLETGERVQKAWNPATNLWEILEHAQAETGKQLTASPEGTHPVFVYMREEVVGEYALRETNLHKMGLISGRAIFRLIYKAIDNSSLEEINTKINKEKARQANILAKSQISDVPIPAVSNTNNQTPETNVKASEPEDMETTAITRLPSGGQVRAENTSAEPMEQEQEAMEVEDKSASAVSSESPMESENVAQAPAARAMVPSRSAPAPRPPTQSQPGPDTSIPGVQIFRPGEAMQGLSDEQEQVARRMAEAIMPGIFPQRTGAEVERLRQEREARIQQAPAPTQHRAAPPVNYAEFKFPEATKGQNLYNNELSEFKDEEYKPCDRETVLYNPESIKTSAAVPVEPGDDFFEITENDLKKMMSDLQRNLVEHSEQPLMTQNMRRAQMESRVAKYSHVFIRFTFPDKLVLQATFRPRETVYSLYKFVKEHLEDKSMPFYLYTSPPKNMLTNKTQTLTEAALVPMTVVYFGSDSKQDHYLSSAVLKELSSPMQATQVVASHMTPVSAEPVSTSGQGTKRATTTSPSSITAASHSGGGKKVPKWFKIGK